MELGVGTADGAGSQMWSRLSHGGWSQELRGWAEPRPKRAKGGARTKYSRESWEPRDGRDKERQNRARAEKSRDRARAKESRRRSWHEVLEGELGAQRWMEPGPSVESVGIGDGSESWKWPEATGRGGKAVMLQKPKATGTRDGAMARSRLRWNREPEVAETEARL